MRFFKRHGPCLIYYKRHRERRYSKMKRKIKNLLFGSLVLGSLVISANPAMARHEWRYEWERRADWRHDYRELDEARRQLNYDLRHGASRRRIAADEARVRALENRMYADSRWSRWYR